MRKILCFIILFTITVAMCSVGISAAEVSQVEKEYLTRAIAVSYPEISFGGRVAIGAVVLNRVAADGYPDSVGGAVMSLAAEGEFAEIWSTAAKIDGELLRITADAVNAAVSGADPTGGAVRFERIKYAPKADLRFDDSREDTAARAAQNYFSEKYGATVTVIDGIGFWGE